MLQCVNTRIIVCGWLNIFYEFAIKTVLYKDTLTIMYAEIYRINVNA